jgi:hypothetical protein
VPEQGHGDEPCSPPSAIADLAAKGVLAPVIEHRFPFERLVDADRIVDPGRKKGSVVVTLDPRAATRREGREGCESVMITSFDV